MPDEARAEVDKELAALDQQIAEAYQRLQNSAQAQQQDSGFADNAIMDPLKDKRAATIDRIAIAIDRVGDRPEGLDALAACDTARAAENQTAASRTAATRTATARTARTRTATARTTAADGQDQGRRSGAASRATAARPATGPWPPTSSTSRPSSRTSQNRRQGSERLPRHLHHRAAA